MTPRFPRQPTPDVSPGRPQRTTTASRLNGQPVIHTTATTLNATPKRLDPRLEPHQTRLVRLLSEPQTDAQTPKTTTPNRLNVPNGVRQQIISMRRAGISRRQIKDKLGLHGEKYEIIRRVLAEEGIE